MKNKGGRKSKYQTHVEPMLFKIECWARDGLIDEQIAKKLGIAYSTFREYLNKFPALSAALKKGKEVVDYEVENALLKRALGYEYDELTYEQVPVKPGRDKGTGTLSLKYFISWIYPMGQISCPSTVPLSL